MMTFTGGRKLLSDSKHSQTSGLCVTGNILKHLGVTLTGTLHVKVTAFDIALWRIDSYEFVIKILDRLNV
jgi:hypothetical protein